VARVLIDKGFLRVRPLAGGFEAWVEAGFDLEDPENVVAVRPAGGGVA
jgi:rhodanese-related sulfurtransferase